MLANASVSNRLTYGATLAELTSLEEMMRQLMEEGHIHDDVVAKLWQVYGTSNMSYLLSFRLIGFVGSPKGLPRYQRRGAIIVIAMLAVAKREVVADRVETLVKIGLGDKLHVGPSPCGVMSWN